MHECEHEGEIKRMSGDITEIKGDVKSLLKFKWQMIGGVSTICVVITIIIGLVK